MHYWLLHLTDLTVDSNDITVLVSGEQTHYFHLWGLQKPLVIFSVPTRENNVPTSLFTLTGPQNIDPFSNISFRGIN
jgi:hypothetical protein